MQTTRESGKLLAVKDGWLMCPACGRSRVLRIYPDTEGKAIAVYCKKCGRESLVDIDKSQSQRHESQSQRR